MINLPTNKYVRGIAKKLERKRSKGLLKNPVFYFSFMSLILFSCVYSSCGSSANVSGLSNSNVVFFNSFFDGQKNLDIASLFSSQAGAVNIESPDLKILQGNTLAGVSTPSIVTGKILGSVLGGNAQNKNKKEIIDYTVQPGDTLRSIAEAHSISVTTLATANEISTSSVLKVGQTLVVLPADGVLHVVASGDTVSGISKTYKSEQDEIISFNNLANQNDIYIGDILVVPGGTMPKKAPVVAQVPLADNYFIFPAEGKISQGLHYYNAVDVANKCGTPIYAATAGVVQRAVSNGGWNLGMGNHITILHSNGTVTYYGHLMSVLVKPGDNVYVGQNIALMGGQPGMAGAGKSTGCHLHFQVVGAKNPLSVYRLGATISYK